MVIYMQIHPGAPGSRHRVQTAPPQAVTEHHCQCADGSQGVLAPL